MEVIDSGATGRAAAVVLWSSTWVTLCSMVPALSQRLRQRLLGNWDWRRLGIRRLTVVISSRPPLMPLSNSTLPADNVDAISRCWVLLLLRALQRCIAEMLNKSATCYRMKVTDNYKISTVLTTPDEPLRYAILFLSYGGCCACCLCELVWPMSF